MKGIFKTSILSILVAGLVLSAVPVFNASADINKPKIRTIESVTSKTVLLPITWHQYPDNVDVKVKVRILNLATGAVTLQQFDTRVNGNGHTKVTVTGLNPSTKYAFKVKIRKYTLQDFSPYSSRKTEKTLEAGK